MTCAEIKKTMKEHGDYASAVMNLRADSITTPIVRYKNFINSNGIVKSIMGEIIEKSVTSPDLFLRDGTSYEVDEIDNLAIFYKHLCYISQEDFNLLSHAVSHYALKYKNFNDMIQALLNFSVLPIIQFIEKIYHYYTLNKKNVKNKSSRSLVINIIYSKTGIKILLKTLKTIIQFINLNLIKVVSF